MIIKKYIECEKLSKALKIWQNKIIETYGKNDEYVKCLDAILLGIDRTPAADVRPVVRGKWIEETNTWANGFRCSECERKIFGGTTNFCPNCGADMREES